ncbi:MAG TPA: hypothetical protein VG167_15845 [Verrucomicrobiae bacterium]|nr:hypothetical protein [Verrucomicrobiae bacterium]
MSDAPRHLTPGVALGAFLRRGSYLVVGVILNVAPAWAQYSQNNITIINESGCTNSFTFQLLNCPSGCQGGTVYGGGTLQPGQSASVNWFSLCGCGYGIGLVGGGGMAMGGGSIIYNAAPGSFCATNCNQVVVKMAVKNNSSGPMAYQMYSPYGGGATNGTYSGGAVPGAVGGTVSNPTFLFLDAGKSGVLSTTVCQQYTNGLYAQAFQNWSIAATQVGGVNTLWLEGLNGDVGTAVPVGLAFGTPGSPPGNPSAPTGGFIYSGATFTNGPSGTGIIYPDQTNLVGSIQQGDQALYDAITHGLGTLHDDLTRLTQVASAGTNGTGSGGGSGTNVYVGSSVYDTNLQTTGISGAMGNGTNQATATTSGTAAASGATSAIDGLSSGLGSAPSLGSGSGGLTASFGFLNGNVLSVDPDTVTGMPVCAWVKGFITLIALIWFCREMGVMIADAASTYSQAEMGGVPNVGVMGFNVQATVIMFIVAGVFVAIWVALFTWLASAVTSWVSQLAGSAGGAACPSSAAWGLVTRVFPVDLLIGLAWARIAAYFGKAKLIVLYSSISRFLMGK